MVSLVSGQSCLTASARTWAAEWRSLYRYSAELSVAVGVVELIWSDDDRNFWRQCETASSAVSAADGNVGTRESPAAHRDGDRERPGPARRDAAIEKNHLIEPVGLADI